MTRLNSQHKLGVRENLILLMQQTHVAFMFFHNHIPYSLQILVKLDLGYNKIEAKGAQYLSEALQKNTVSLNQHCFHVFP